MYKLKDVLIKKDISNNNINKLYFIFSVCTKIDRPKYNRVCLSHPTLIKFYFEFLWLENEIKVYNQASKNSYIIKYVILLYIFI